ncbi:hypothetical protein TNCV_4757791 [Trichonephila clavipes]|nr:hypothetical protein TNCV_4757791 [Trichonephila clavipes]
MEALSTSLTEKKNGIEIFAFPPLERQHLESQTVGILVVIALDSRPECLCSMPNATKYPLSTHEFHAEIVEVDIGGVAIYHPFGDFRQANSYCHLYGAEGQRQKYF